MDTTNGISIRCRIIASDEDSIQVTGLSFAAGQPIERI